MKNKFKFLTKMSLDRKIKTKWFLIANVILAIVIIGICNIDNIIKFFGGDFDEKLEYMLLIILMLHIIYLIIILIKDLNLPKMKVMKL